MARSTAEIQKQITDAVAADPDLSTQLTSTSKRAIWRLWTFITAVAIATFEQIMDVFRQETTEIIATNPVQIASWLQAKIFEFQYSPDNPQVIQLINFVPKYPVIDPTLRIISRCSVKTDINSSVKIKVATGNPPAALDSSQIAALQSYVDLLAIPGISYNVIAINSDKIMIQADVYYNGAYANNIKETVIQAINDYLANIAFDGNIQTSDIETAIKNALGVKDCTLQNVIARADGTPLVDGTYLVKNAQYIGRIWPTVSGYAVGEDTAGSTFADTLNFIAI